MSILEKVLLGYGKNTDISRIKVDLFHRNDDSPTYIFELWADNGHKYRTHPDKEKTLVQVDVETLEMIKFYPYDVTPIFNTLVDLDNGLENLKVSREVTVKFL